MRRCMISVPKEVKPSEGRVGVVPDDVRTLRSLGVLVGVEHGAGLLSGFSDEEYRSAVLPCLEERIDRPPDFLP